LLPGIDRGQYTRSVRSRGYALAAIELLRVSCSARKAVSAALTAGQIHLGGATWNNRAVHGFAPPR
jgi:hypothetical protein